MTATDRRARPPDGPQHPVSSRSGRRLSAIRIVVVYAVVGALWILLSDRVLGTVFPTGQSYTLVQTIKGWGFVAATTGLLYYLIRRSRRSLERSESQLKAVFEGSPDAVLFVNPEGDILQMNGAAVRLLGLEGGPPLTSLRDAALRLQMLHLDGRPVHPDEYATNRALRGETVVGYEARLRRADGLERFASIRAAPITQGDRVLGAITILRDVTREKELELTRDAFMADAAHELKTPMTTIRAHVQLLEDTEAAGDPALGEPLRTIQRQVDRLNRIVQNLMEVSRLRAGAIDLHREQVNLADLARHVVSDVQATATRHAIRMGETQQTPVRCDPVRLGEVVRNLLDNAIRFQPGGGSVEVAVRRNDGHAVLQVTDHGVGIPEDGQSQIFQPFARPHQKTVYANVSGIGVGLYVSSAIVQDHGGQMSFESREGNGSTFTVELPLTDGSVELREEAR